MKIKTEKFKITTYSNYKSDRPDCLLLCLHSDDGIDFYENNPLLREALQDSEGTFKKFLKIEYDFGTRELAHTTAKKLVENSKKKIRVDIFDVQIPRGILDLGRISSEKAIRNVFDFRKNEKILKQLRILHKKTMKNIFKTIKSLKPGGVWLDIHSMSPYDPVIQTKVNHLGPDPVIPSAGNLENYIKQYTGSSCSHRRININLATDINETGKNISDKILTSKLNTELLEADLQCQHNSPHAMNLSITAAHIMKNFGRGLLIDFPKDFISKETGKKALENLDQLEMDQNKLLKISESLAHGLERRLEMKIESEIKKTDLVSKLQFEYIK